MIRNNMCGIFSYIGKEENAALQTLVGLQSLEYRGYDSFGITAQKNGGAEFFVRKSVGQIGKVGRGEFSGIKSSIAIGHTRWATHGNVTEANAHPHFNRTQSIAVVHNGIIENHRVLRAFVADKLKVHKEDLFVSETDTEVIPHLIEYFMTHEAKDFEDAFVATALLLEGRYAFVAMHRDLPYILAVRDGSPLVLGEGAQGYYLASDVPAFLDYTRIVNYLDDEQYVKVSRDESVIRELRTRKFVKPDRKEILWERESATKEGYAHYMLKEIMEQPSALDRAIRQDDEELLAIAHLLKTHRTFFIGCGTAAKVAKIGELWMATMAHRLATTFVGSESAPYAGFVDKKSVLLAVSQSGETADVLQAIRAAGQSGATIVSLLNVVGSTIDRESDLRLFINVGPEKAVASTKAATAQMAVLYLLIAATAGELPEAKHLLRKGVKEIKAWLTRDLVREIEGIAKRIVAEEDLFIIGRGTHAALALEAAIKIQEVSYVHAEGFPGGELKHGPIALIRKGTPCIAFIPNDETKAKMESNTTELKARGAYIIGIAPSPSDLFDEWIKVPDLGPIAPIVDIIPVQILAYALAVLRGNDPDKPRNLAKSVTVE